MLADAMRGEDPVEIRKIARKAPSIADLAADYLERHAVPKKRPKSVRGDRAMLDNVILPKLGAKKVDAIGRRDVEAIQVAMKDRPYQANRVLSLLSKCSTCRRVEVAARQPGQGHRALRGAEARAMVVG